MNMKKILLIMACFSLIVFILLPSIYFDNKFLDDDEYFYYNRLVTNPSISSLGTIFSEVLAPSTIKGYYQPLTMTSLMFDYWLGARAHNTTIIRIHSLLIHLFCTALLMYLLFLLSSNFKCSLLAGLFWSIHPSCVEAISWISERKTLLATLFGLLSIIIYIFYHKKKTRYYIFISEFFFFLAFLSKPIVSTIPLMLLVLDFCFFSNLSLNKILEKWRFFVISFSLTLVTIYSQIATAGYKNSITLKTSENIIVLLLRIKYYILIYFFPINISPINPYPSIFPISIQTVSSFVVLLALLSTMFLSFKYNKPIFAGLSFYCLTLLPVILSTVATFSFVSFRYLYFPSIGFSLIFLAVFSKIPSRFKTFYISRIGVFSLAFCFIFVIGSTKTYLNTWRTELSTYENFYNIYPNYDVAQYMFSKVMLKNKYYSRSKKIAEDIINSSTSSDTIQKEAYYILFKLSLRENNYTLAQKYLNINLKGTGSIGSTYDFGLLNICKGNHSEAERQFLTAFRLYPSDMFRANALANIYILQGKIEEANKVINESLIQSPNNEDLITMKAFAKLKESKIDESMLLLQKSININSENPQTCYLLSEVYKLQGDTKKSIYYSVKAKELDILGLGLNIPY